MLEVAVRSVFGPDATTRVVVLLQRDDRQPLLRELVRGDETGDPRAHHGDVGKGRGALFLADDDMA